MSASPMRLGALLALALAATGCTTLGGNVAGDFACRAPDGTCAPTSQIDETATAAMAAPRSDLPHGPHASAFVPGHVPGRTMRVVLAGHVDEAGRRHEARVVHVTLPEPVEQRWRAPRSIGEMLRALGRAGKEQRGAVADKAAGIAEPGLPPASSHFPPHLPDVLVLPAQTPPALPGASAPDTGAPGRHPSPGRVPQPEMPEGDEL